MNIRNKCAQAALALGISSISALAGATVTVGNNDGGNCYPFSCLASDIGGTGSRYQEIYSASAFSGVTSVGSITFFQSIAGLMDSASYSISFYKTSVGIGGMSADADSNLGALLSTFGTFSVSGSMPVELTFDGADFSYNPAEGNLLMDVKVLSLTESHGYESYFQADYTGVDVVRGFAYGGDLTGFNNVGALRTRFNDATAVPEPGTVTLAGLALLAMVGMRRRSRQTRS